MHEVRSHLAWFVGDAAGARARLAAVRPHLTGVRLTALTLGPAPELEQLGIGVVALPWSARMQRAPGGGPGDFDGDTASRLLNWFHGARPDLLVADGSGAPVAEGAAAGVQIVSVRRPGAIGDRLADGGGTVRELAPYPAVLEPDATPRWVRERTVHVGLLSRFSGRRPHGRAGRRALGIADDARVVTLLCGRDGLGGASDVASAAAATPTWTWVTVGRCGTPAEGLPSNVRRLGWTDDPWHALEAADVVVGRASLSVVAETATARRPLLVVPGTGDRVGDEVLPRLLASVGAATSLSRWPDASEWPSVLAAAAGIDPGPLERLEDGRGAARAADWLATWSRPATSDVVPLPDGRRPHRSARRDRTIDVTTSSSRPAATVGPSGS